jgi:CBS domain-containing protein
MNILFFLTPKSEVIYVNEEDTVGQAMDTMEKYKYSAVPIITKAGRYAGTLTEGDLLWGLKNKTDLVQKGLEKVRITEIPRRSDNQPVLVNADMEDLLGKIMNQNFVPVLDDQKNLYLLSTTRNILSVLLPEKMLSVTFVKNST